tara:strand:- start:2203 stop:3522 length:1320 start_codon:yes stop_codon:yes gene_type:complete
MRYFFFRYLVLLFIISFEIYSQNEVSSNFFLIGEGNYKITYFSPSNLNFKNTNIKRLIIVIHGNGRNAINKQNDIIQAANTADKYLETLIIVPHFIGTQELIDNNLDDNNLYWKDGGWMEGGNSNSSGAYPRDESFSSFEVIDDIISQIILGGNFSNISQVILTGFSAGGQFMNRYASSNRIQDDLEKEEGIDFRYIIGSPSSYLYFNDERRVEGTVDQFAKPNATNCGLYNNYKYGTVIMNQYMKYYNLDTLINRYYRRKISYGVGSKDNNPNSSSMDDSCPAMFQGNHRVERATIFTNYLKHFYAEDFVDNHKLYIAQGVYHNSRAFYNKNTIIPLLFPEIINNPSEPLGIENYEKVKIYPIPTNKILNIESSSRINKNSIVIYDIFGRIISNYNILKSNNNSIKIDLLKFTDGHYFIFFNNFENSYLLSKRFLVKK